VKFESDIIPQDVRAQIEAALPACKTRTDVRKLFSTVINKPVGKSEIMLLAEAINKAVK